MNYSLKDQLKADLMRLVFSLNFPSNVYHFPDIFMKLVIKKPITRKCFDFTTNTTNYNHTSSFMRETQHRYGNIQL